MLAHHPDNALVQRFQRDPFMALQFDHTILAVALSAVVVILFWGIFTMARGGSYNVKNSNRLMRYRIIFQAAALLIILGLMWQRGIG